MSEPVSPHADVLTPEVIVFGPSASSSRRPKAPRYEASVNNIARMLRDLDRACRAYPYPMTEHRYMGVVSIAEGVCERGVAVNAPLQHSVEVFSATLQKHEVFQARLHLVA